MFVQIFSELQYILLPNLVLSYSIISQSVMQKNRFIVFNVKVTARAYIIKIWLFLLYLLNYLSVCHQTWFDSTASQAGVSCGKMGLLLDDIFWITEHFVTKFGMVMQHHEPECHVENFFLFLSSRSRSQRELIWSKYDFLLYFLNCWFLGNQT